MLGTLPRKAGKCLTEQRLASPMRVLDWHIGRFHSGGSVRGTRGGRGAVKQLCFIVLQGRGYGDELAAPMSSVEAPTDSNKSTMKWWHVNTSTWWVSASRAKASAA